MTRRTCGRGSWASPGSPNRAPPPSPGEGGAGKGHRGRGRGGAGRRGSWGWSSGPGRTQGFLTRAGEPARGRGRPSGHREFPRAGTSLGVPERAGGAPRAPGSGAGPRATWDACTGPAAPLAALGVEGSSLAPSAPSNGPLRLRGAPVGAPLPPGVPDGGCRARV